MQGVFSRRLIAVLALVVLLAVPNAFADTATADDEDLWAQFTAWLGTDGQIGFEDWLVMMGRIWIPNG